VLDQAIVARALKRAVYVDHLLTLEQARAYAEIVGIPASAYEEAAG